MVAPSEPTISENVEIQIRPHPQQPNLKDTVIKNLVTSPLCTMSHLVRYMGLNPLNEGA